MSDPSPFDTPEIHRTPTLATTLTETRAYLERFVCFPRNSQCIILSLFVAHTHTIEAAEFTPYIHITSPEKGCGKTRTLDALEFLVRHPISAVQLSAAVTFRMIEAEFPTLLLDETDTIFNGGKSDDRSESIRGILNAGFKRGGTVFRCDGTDHKFRKFSVFCPKVLAGIGALPGTIADRAIPIVLARRPQSQKLEKFRAREVRPIAAEIHAQFVDWANAITIETLQSARPAIPDALGDRQGDICEPLLAVADLAGGEWPEAARAALLDIFSHADTSATESAGVTTLRAIHEYFAATSAPLITTADLLNYLCDQEQGPWAVWWGQDIERNNLKGPAAKLAKLLRKYSIAPHTIRHGSETAKGYRRDQFTEAWASYCPEPVP